MKLVNEINMGNHFILTHERKDGSKVASLHSGNHFAELEVEKTKDNKIRIKEMNLGSAIVEPEHLAILFREAGITEIIKEVL